MKDYIEVSINYSGYKVIMRLDKEELIENYKHFCTRNKMMKKPVEGIKKLIQIYLLDELKTIIGTENTLKLVKI